GVALDGADAAVGAHAGDHADVVGEAVAVAVEDHQGAGLGRGLGPGRHPPAGLLAPRLDVRHPALAAAVGADGHPGLRRDPRAEVAAPGADARVRGGGAVLGDAGAVVG